jgi:RNA 2',3'-cyclic 3'-phosphodiesterase
MEKHVFIAVELPSSVKAKLEHACGRIKEHYSFKTWVHPEDYHITLAFLGKTESSKLDKLKGLLKDIAIKQSVFSTVINHFGFFGNKKQPRIFWTGMKKQPELYNLQRQVAHACEKAGIILESRPYSPHITLARKLEEPFGSSAETEKWWEEFGEEINFQATNFVIYQTNLEKTPKYQILESFSLT